jgi:hypothetical protein
MTTGDSDDRSLLCVFEHNRLSILLFLILREFKMLEVYLDVLKMKIIKSKYSYIFVII